MHQVIPLLPCDSLAQTLKFYRALGFEVTTEQQTPYVYGGVQRHDVHLHFRGAKGSKQGPATC